MISYDLRECLSPLSSERLRAIAEKLGLSTKKDLIPNIVAMLSHRETARALLASLPAESRAALRSVYLSGGVSSGFAEKKVLESASFRPVLDLGICFAGRIQSGTMQAVLPKELEPAVREIACGLGMTGVKTSSDASNVISHGDKFMRNVTTLLMLAESEPIPMNQDGMPRKKHILKHIEPCLESFDDAEEEDDPSPSFDHLLGFMLHFGILARDGDRVRRGPAADAWLSAEKEAVPQSFRAYAWELSPTPAGGVLLDMLHAEEDAWLSRADLFAAIHPGKKSAEARGDFERLMRFMLICGMIDEGDSGIGKVVSAGIMMSGARRHPGEVAFTVTPDYKIMAPRHLDPQARLEIGSIARFIKSDMMDEWEITRESVRRAADNGLDAASVLAVLSRRGAAAVPSNVAAGIECWIKDHLAVRSFEGKALIVDPDSQEIDRVKSIVLGEAALLAMPAPNVFLVDASKWDAVLHKLTSRRSVSPMKSRTRARTPSKAFGKIVAESGSARETQKARYVQIMER